MKLKLSVWVRMWRKHKVAQKHKRTRARKDLGMLKAYPRERKTRKVHLLSLQKNLLRQCKKLDKSKKHGKKGKQDMKTEAQFKSDFSEYNCLCSQA